MDFNELKNMGMFKAMGDIAMGIKTVAALVVSIFGLAVFVVTLQINTSLAKDTAEETEDRVTALEKQYYALESDLRSTREAAARTEQNTKEIKEDVSGIHDYIMSQK